MSTKCLYLSRADVERASVGMKEIIRTIEEMFVEKAEGRVEMPPKPGIHPKSDAFIHAMPAFIPAFGAAGVKWVSGFPDNPKSGRPYISGLLVLNDPESGIPLSIMDCTWITAMRTGAATAVAAKRLARSDSKVMGILGCGVQGRSNLEAVAAVFPLEKVIAYDTAPGALAGFRREMEERTGLRIVAAQTPEEAVRESDVVVTAGPLLKVPHATIRPGWLSSGAFASLVDYDSYWSRGALKEADKFCTDDVLQMEYYKSLGYFAEVPPVYAELAELVTEKKPGRETDSERTMTCNLGLALEDMAVAPLVYRKAIENNLGTWLEL